MIKIALASAQDLDYLEKHDHHLARAALTRKQQAGELIVAFDGDSDTPIGLLRFNYFWDEIPFMNMLRVNDNWRGQGVGTSLVTFWENLMRQQHHNLVMTSTLSDETAQHFYRKLGYEDAGGFRFPGEALEIMFIKRL